mmetsp:Transcript_97346/g.208871  ORF Transcript_97346/g.208871 Transcript_97346/m.208871 type:complete len:206 (+) Transcript_97346:414-1031(+)
MDLRDSKFVNGTDKWPKRGYELVKSEARDVCGKAHLPFELDIVVVLDSDIIVAQPVAQFLMSLHSSSLQPLATFHDSLQGGDKFHAGLVVTWPASKACLHQWNDQIRSAAFAQTLGPGQRALNRTSCAQNGVIKLMPSMGFANGQQEFFGWPTIDSCTTNKSWVFMHLTDWRLREVVNATVVQSFVERNLEHDFDIIGSEICPKD